MENIPLGTKTTLILLMSAGQKCRNWKYPHLSFVQYLETEDAKFDTNVSNKKSLNVTKCQGDSFYCFWVIKKNPTGGGKITCPPWLGLKCGYFHQCIFQSLLESKVISSYSSKQRSGKKIFQQSSTSCWENNLLLNHPLTI